MFLVFGATGTTGGEVARQLIAAGERPRLLLRNQEKARAFDGQADLVEVEARAIRAAKDAGVRHVVKL